MKIKEMAGNDKAKLAIACIAIGLALITYNLLRTFTAA